MTDKSFGCLQDIEQAHAQTNLLNNLIRELSVDGIFEGLRAGPAGILWRNLNQILNRGLEFLLVRIPPQEV